MARGVIPTAVDLLKKQVDISLHCQWCHNYAEDAAHVFFECCFAREIWAETGFNHVIYTGESETGMQVIRRVFSTATKDQCLRFGLLCWGIWMRRNKRVWGRVCMSVSGVKHMVMNLIADWNRAREVELAQNRPGNSVKRWGKPANG